MKKSITKFVVALGLFAAGIMGITHTEKASAGSVDVQVTPSYFKLDLEPGETYTDKFTVTNNGDADIILKTGVSSYAIESDDAGKYNPTFDQKTEYNMIVDWSSVAEDSIIVPKKSTTDVNFSIKVPQDAPGGGQYEYISVTASSGANLGGEGVSIGQNASIGPVVYATVSGETRREGAILSHDINGFMFNPPITATSLVENKGNVHTNATYILRVYPFFGGESLYNNEDNPSELTLLPGTKRYYTSSWDNAPSIGIYKVESEVKIFDEVSKVEKMVIICPMWVLILIAVFILAVIFWIVTRVKARKAES